MDAHKSLDRDFGWTSASPGICVTFSRRETNIGQSQIRSQCLLGCTRYGLLATDTHPEPNFANRWDRTRFKQIDAFARSLLMGSAQNQRGKEGSIQYSLPDRRVMNSPLVFCYRVHNCYIECYRVLLSQMSRFRDSSAGRMVWLSIPLMLYQRTVLVCRILLVLVYVLRLVI